MRGAQQAAREAERRFAVRIKVGVPEAGRGERLHQMRDWLDQNARADGWAMTPSGVRRLVNDAVATYFADVTIASAFVARWCQVQKVEAVGGLYRVREDAPTPRRVAARHKTP